MNGLSAKHAEALKKIHITIQLMSEPVTSKANWKTIVDLFSLPLTSVTLSGLEVHPVEDLHAINHFNLKHLTELNLRVYNASNGHVVPTTPIKFTFTLIRQCQSLKTLYLDFRFGAMANAMMTNGQIVQNQLYSQFDHDVILHPTLHETGSFLEHLDLPSLKRLDLEIYDLKDLRVSFTERSAPIPDLLGVFLQRCGDTLQSLGFHASPKANAVMVQLLRLTPNLRCLSFFNGPLCIKHNRWKLINLNMSWSQTHGQAINDDFLYALSPLRKQIVDVISRSWKSWTVHVNPRP
ncbi:hypothetical protein BDQ17DRAFT_990684 [Cyathus striatus]|nr:hypothetical protein BDQ17DRAFT_990684 [Cyathus striatus]